MLPLVCSLVLKCLRITLRGWCKGDPSFLRLIGHNSFRFSSKPAVWQLTIFSDGTIYFQSSWFPVELWKSSSLNWNIYSDNTYNFLSFTSWDTKNKSNFSSLLAPWNTIRLSLLTNYPYFPHPLGFWSSHILFNFLQLHSTSKENVRAQNRTEYFNCGLTTGYFSFTIKLSN